MIDLAELSSAFRPIEVETLARAYDYSLSYLDRDLGSADRRFLARLTIMAAVARCRQEKPLTSIVDAHALAAEVVDFFLSLEVARANGAI